MADSPTPLQISGTVPFATSPNQLWDILIDPPRLSACVPGLQRWETIEPNRTFTLWLGWQSDQSLIPVTLIWEKQTPPTEFIFRGQVAFGSVPFPTDGSIHLQETAVSQTDLHFTLTLHTDNKMIWQIATTLIPKAADAFFSCLKKQLQPLP